MTGFITPPDGFWRILDLFLCFKIMFEIMFE